MAERTESAGDAHAARDAVLQALGVDPATVVWPTATQRGRDTAAADAPMPRAARLDDAEWEHIAPLLPAEAPQAAAMTNRCFLDAVLAAMQRGGAWTSRATPTAEIEPVRRRFGRWARLEVFQKLAAVGAGLDLTPETRRLLALAGQRAANLRARAAGQH